MNLSPPTTAVFVISLILAVLAIIGTFVANSVDQRQRLLGGHHRLCDLGRRERLPRRLVPVIMMLRTASAPSGSSLALNSAKRDSAMSHLAP